MGTPVPRYYTLFTILRQRISDGTYQAGQKLAPEVELCAEWGVSRATVRQAVGELVRHGFVSREQGRGTFVLDQRSTSVGPVFQGSLDDLVSETHLTKMAKVRVARNAAFPVHIAERLGFQSGRGTIVRRVRVDGKVPFGYLVNYVPEQFSAPLTVANLRETTLLEVLETIGVHVTRAEQTVRARVADVDVAANLEIGLGDPVMGVERMMFDTGGRPIEFLRSWYRGDMYQYRVVLSR